MLIYLFIFLVYAKSIITMEENIADEFAGQAPVAGQSDALEGTDSEDTIRTTLEEITESGAILQGAPLTLKTLCLKTIADLIVNSRDLNFEPTSLTAGRAPQELLEELELVLYKDYSEEVSYAIISSFTKKKIRPKKEDSFIAIDANNKFIAIGTHNGIIRIYDVLQDKEFGKPGPHLIKAHVIKGHESNIFFISSSSDGQFIVSASIDKNIKVWNTQSGKCLYSIKSKHSNIKSLTISFDNKFVIILYWDHSIKLWNLQSGSLSSILDGLQSAVAISANSKYIVAYSAQNKIKVYNMQSETYISFSSLHSGPIYLILITSNNRFIITSGLGDHTVKIWNIETGECIRDLNIHLNMINSVAVSADNTFLVTGSSDKTAKVWSFDSDTFLYNFEGHTHIITSVAISPNKKFIGTGSYDGVIKIWHTQTGVCLFTLSNNHDLIKSLTITFIEDSNKMIIIANSFPLSVRTWHVQLANFNELVNNIKLNSINKRTHKQNTKANKNLSGSRPAAMRHKKNPDCCAVN